jgi:hypothetical protein
MICFPLPILDPVRFESRFNLSGKEEVVVHRKGVIPALSFVIL